MSDFFRYWQCESYQMSTFSTRELADVSSPINACARQVAAGSPFLDNSVKFYGCLLGRNNNTVFHKTKLPHFNLIYFLQPRMTWRVAMTTPWTGKRMAIRKAEGKKHSPLAGRHLSDSWITESARTVHDVANAVPLRRCPYYE